MDRAKQKDMIGDAYLLDAQERGLKEKINAMKVDIADKADKIKNLENIKESKALEESELKQKESDLKTVKGDLDKVLSELEADGIKLPLGDKSITKSTRL